MKTKTVLLSFFSLSLLACSSELNDAEENNSEIAESQEQVEEEIEYITFTSGVTGGAINGNEDNYVDITGKAVGYNTIYVIFDGTVIDTIDVNSNNEWEYYTNGGDRGAELSFTTDDSVSFGDTNVNIYDLNYVVTKYYTPNPVATSKESTDENIDDTESTATDTGQRTNPVSFGDTMYMVGTFTDRDADYEEFDANIELTIMETIRGEEAWEQILNENQFNDPAPEGKEYIINRVRIALNNATNDNLKTEFKYNEFDYISGKGASYTSTFQIIPEKLDVELYNNGEAEGNVFGLINIDDTPLLRFNNTFFFEIE